MLSPPLPPATLEVYYASSCAPCRLELPVLAEVAREASAGLRIVVVGDKASAMHDLNAASPMLALRVTVGTNADVRKTLFAAGDEDAVLPYARTLTPAGKICSRWRGRLTIARARALVSACLARFNAPYRRRS